MHLEVTFRNLSARDEIKKRADALFAKLHRFLDQSSQAQLTVGHEHNRMVLELVVTSHGEPVKVEEEDEDLRTALDRLFHTAEHRLRRIKERLEDRRTRGAGEPIDGFGEEAEA
jgi:ribosomal subunit interface protein